MDLLNKDSSPNCTIVDVDFSLENMSAVDKQDLVMIKSAMTYCAKDIAGLQNPITAVIRHIDTEYRGVQLKSYIIFVRFPSTTIFNDQHYFDIKMINIHRFWDKIESYYSPEPSSMMLRIPVDSHICPINNRNFSFSIINMQSPHIMLVNNGRDEEEGADSGGLRRNRNSKNTNDSITGKKRKRDKL